MISLKMHYRLGERLGLSESQLKAFVASSIPNPPLPLYAPMASEVFEVISDWYHHAILELTKTKSFKNDPKWIARKLDISSNQARIAVERLIQVGLLSRQGKILSSQNSTLHHDLKAAAFRQLQEQILELSAKALREIPIEQRDQSSMTMAIDPRLLPKARELIKKFRRQLCKLLQEGSSVDEVYQLSVSLFPLTRLQKK